MRARLKSGSFHARFPVARVYRKGDVIDDIEDVPVVFRDRWEEIPPPVRRVEPAPIVKEEEPKPKEEPPKSDAAVKPKSNVKKPTTRKSTTTIKKTGSRRASPKKK